MAGFINFVCIDGELPHRSPHFPYTTLFRSQVVHKTGGGKTGSTRRGGDVQFEDVHVDKEVDKSSGRLHDATADRKAFGKLEIDITATYTDAGRVTYYHYELKNVQVSSYQVG